MVGEMQRLYPNGPRFIAVPNGFDDDPLPMSVADPRFLIAYAGTIYLDRDPRVLFRAAAQVIARYALTPAQFGIEFMGDVRTFDGISLDQLAAREGVGAFVKLHAVRPRHEALAFLGSASMLVQLPQDSDIVIPGKLYEYMRFHAWLLVLARRGNASAVMLRGLDVDIIEPGDIDSIADAMAHRYEQHARGERAQPLARHDQFSRRARAVTFFDALERLTGAPTPALHSEPRGASVQRREATKSLEHGGARISPAPDLLMILPRTQAKEFTKHGHS
jgi:glycosyltransferase involved in cell wall biosynthesis